MVTASPPGRGRPFRFEAHWIRHSDCENVVRSNWGPTTGGGSFEQLFEGIISSCELGLRLTMGQ